MSCRLLTEVPPLPANFAGRVGLCSTLLSGLRSALASSGLCVLHGEGGMGKTVMASSLLREREDLGSLFPEVAFVTVGQMPDIPSLQATLLCAFGVTEPPADAADGYARLLGALGGRQCLIVLDDVWEASHLECFVPQQRPQAWQQVAVLCTSRFSSLSPRAELIRLGELTDPEVSQLLGFEGSELPRIAKLCARSPLALSIFGATRAQSAAPWKALCEELSALTESNPVKRCICLAVTRLSKEASDLYKGFAVFPDDVLLPVPALKTIFTERDVERLLPQLAVFHLIRLEGNDAAFLKVGLHDLSLEFVKQVAQKLPGGEVGLHKALVQSYRKALSGDWWTGPDDGYFFQRLLYHLAAAGHVDEARDVLLRWDWLAARLRAPGDALALVADVRELAPPGALRPHRPKVVATGSGASAAKVVGKRGSQVKGKTEAKAEAKAEAKGSKPREKTSPETGHWEALLEVLALSAHVLAEEPKQLPFQVLGRLLGCENPVVSALRAGATAALKKGVYPVGQSRCSLRPVSAGSLNLVGGPLLRTLQLHRDWVRCLALSSDGRQLISASNDLTVKVWDLDRDCRLVHDLLGHSSAVFLLDICQDLLASGDKDEIIIWTDGNLLRRLPGFEGKLAAFRFLGTTHLAVAVQKSVSVQPIAKATEHHIVCSQDAQISAMAGCRLSDDFLLALSGEDGHVGLWRVSLKPSATKIAALIAGLQDVRALLLAPDAAGAVLVAGNDDASLHMWAVKADGKKKVEAIHKLSCKGVHSDWIHSVSLSQDGSLIACGADDKSISVFHVASKRVVGRMNIFSGAFSVVLTPDEALICSASGDIRVWSVAKALAQDGPVAAKHASTVLGLDVSEDGRVAVSVSACLNAAGKCAGLELRCWNCETCKGTACFSIPSPAEEDHRPVCLCVSPDGTKAAVGADTGKLWFINLDSGEVEWQVEAHEDRIFCCCWVDGCVATGGKDGYLKMWSSGICKSTAQPFESDVRCLAFESARRVLCSGFYMPPRYLDLGSDCRVICELKDPRKDLSASTACSISLFESRAVTCSWDASIRLWDLPSGALLLAVEQVSEWVTKGFGATLAAGHLGLCVSYTWDRQLQLWDLSSCLTGRARGLDVATAADFPGRLSSCQCDSSLVLMACARRWTKGVHRTLVISDEDGRLHFFEVDLCS